MNYCPECESSDVVRIEWRGSYDGICCSCGFRWTHINRRPGAVMAAMTDMTVAVLECHPTKDEQCQTCDLPSPCPTAQALDRVWDNVKRT